MPLVKSKSKKAFSANIKAEMDAGKPQKQAVAIAYSVKRKAKKRGGFVGADGDMMLNPRHKFTFAMGGPIKLPPKPEPYTRDRVVHPNQMMQDKQMDQIETNPATGFGLEVGYRKAGGGEAELPDVGSPLIDPGPQVSAGSPWANKAADIASHIAGHSVIGGATLPYRYVTGITEAARQPFNSPEAHEALGNVGGLTGEMAMQMAGPKGGPKNTSGVFVGPYGALALRNAEHEAGLSPRPHPVYAAEDMAHAQALRPEFRDEFLRWRGDARDAAGQQALEMRGAAGNAYDKDVFPATGWLRGPGGQARKEIPDIGAKLSLNEATGNYRLEHPAGDLHKIYDVPDIVFDPQMKPGTGYAKPASRQIIIGGPPTAENIKKSTSTALHEFQHIIQRAEGFPMGSNPEAAKYVGPIHTEYFPGEHPSWWQGKDAAGRKKGPDDLYAKHAPEKGAAYNSYERAAGEVEARNVERRRREGFRYQTHPEFSEDVPRGLQWEPNFDQLKEIENRLKRGEIVGTQFDQFKKADGGSIAPPPWFVRNEARSSLGMIKSSIPGRTDKIPMNLPNGSYVLPADIPSALGQGNTMAGGSILDRMFNKGPYGMSLPRAKSGSSTKMSRMSSLTKVRKSGYADGGDTEGTAPIIAAGGEYVLSPEQVAMVGGGDMERGHTVLDAFVKNVRSKHIDTLKKLPGPKKN